MKKFLISFFVLVTFFCLAGCGNFFNPRDTGAISFSIDGKLLSQELGITQASSRASIGRDNETFKVQVKVFNAENEESELITEVNQKLTLSDKNIIKITGIPLRSKINLTCFILGAAGDADADEYYNIYAVGTSKNNTVKAGVNKIPLSLDVVNPECPNIDLGIICGNIHDKSGDPVENAIVFAYLNGSAEPSAIKITDSDGKYELALEEGQYSIKVLSENLMTSAATNSLIQVFKDYIADEETDLVLDIPLTLKGRVIYNDKGLHGAKVYLDGMSFVCYTNVDGEFKIYWVPVLENEKDFYTIYAEYDGEIISQPLYASDLEELIEEEIVLEFEDKNYEPSYQILDTSTPEILYGDFSGDFPGVTFYVYCDVKDTTECRYTWSYIDEGGIERPVNETSNSYTPRSQTDTVIVKVDFYEGGQKLSEVAERTFKLKSMNDTNVGRLCFDGTNFLGVIYDETENDDVTYYSIVSPLTIHGIWSTIDKLTDANLDKSAFDAMEIIMSQFMWKNKYPLFAAADALGDDWTVASSADLSKIYYVLKAIDYSSGSSNYEQTNLEVWGIDNMGDYDTYWTCTEYNDRFAYMWHNMIGVQKTRKDSDTLARAVKIVKADDVQVYGLDKYTPTLSLAQASPWEELEGTYPANNDYILTAPPPYVDLMLDDAEAEYTFKIYKDGTYLGDAEYDDEMYEAYTFTIKNASEEDNGQYTCILQIKAVSTLTNENDDGEGDDTGPDIVAEYAPAQSEPLNLTFVDISYAYYYDNGTSNLLYCPVGKPEYTALVMSGDGALLNVAISDFTDGTSVYIGNSSGTLYYLDRSANIKTYDLDGFNSNQLKDIVYYDNAVYTLLELKDSYSINKYSLENSSQVEQNAGINSLQGEEIKSFTTASDDEAVKFAVLNEETYAYYLSGTKTLMLVKDGADPEVIDVKSLCYGEDADFFPYFTVSDLAFTDENLWILVSEVGNEYGLCNLSDVYSRGALIKYSLESSAPSVYGWSNNQYNNVENGEEMSYFYGPVRFLAVNSRKITIADHGVEVEEYTEPRDKKSGVIHNQSAIVTFDIESEALTFAKTKALTFGKVVEAAGCENNFAID